MRCLGILLLTSCLLTGCSLSLSDLATTGGATAGAVVGTVTGSLPATVILTTTGGVVAGALVEEPESDVDVLNAIPEEERAGVAKQQALFNAIEHFGMYILGLIGFLIIMAWLIPGPQSLLPWRKK